MENATFCTCKDLNCPNHPTNHSDGCTPCIIKNLQSKEIPACFFKKVPGHENVKDYYFKDFAELVLKEK